MHITTSALIARINRSLAPDYLKLRKTRGQRANIDLGDYYVHDYFRSAVVDKFVDLESFARDIGVLKEYEVVSN